MRHYNPDEFEGPQERVLRKAAYYVNQGWVQGVLHNDNGSCIRGAVEWALQDIPTRYMQANDIWTRLLDKANAKYPKPARPGWRRWLANLLRLDRAAWASLPEFNDAPGRKVEDVLDVIESVRQDIRAKALVDSIMV